MRKLMQSWGMTKEQAAATTYVEAHRIMDILANNGWRKPAGVAV
jgi:hypothetical protein